jgi:hypothetical protein
VYRAVRRPATGKGCLSRVAGESHPGTQTSAQVENTTGPVVTTHETAYRLAKTDPDLYAPADTRSSCPLKGSDETASETASGHCGVVAAGPATILLAACSSSSSTSPTTSSSAAPTTSAPPVATTTTTAATANFNSCSVVTQAEAASAIGQSVTPGVLGNATVEGGLACVFYGPSSPAPTTPNVALADTVRVVVKGSDALTWYNNYKSSPQVHAQSITGYGDQAFYDGAASLSVLKGNTYLRVAVVPAGAAPSLSAEEQLATAILPKL